MFKMTALALALTAAMVGSAFAGDQYVDKTGFAVSGYDVVSYFDLPQSKVGKPQQPPLPGQASITADYNGATFAFATEANRDRFLADPAAFVPQYDAHCAYGVAKGGKVPGNPTLWRIVDGKLYLNYDAAIQKDWLKDKAGFIKQADAKFPQLLAK